MQYILDLFIKINILGWDVGEKYRLHIPSFQFDEYCNIQASMSSRA